MDAHKSELLRLWLRDLESCEKTAIPESQLRGLLGEIEYQSYKKAVVDRIIAEQKQYECELMKARAAIPPRTELAREYLTKLNKLLVEAGQLEEKVLKAALGPPSRSALRFGYLSPARRRRKEFIHRAHTFAMRWDDLLDATDRRSLVRPGDLANGRRQTLTPENYHLLHAQVLVADQPENYVMKPSAGREREYALDFLFTVLNREH